MNDTNRNSPRDFIAIAAVVFAIVVSLVGACTVIADSSASAQHRPIRLALA
ncbi:MAG TPA: hypothetical protein VLT89_09565 [Usitatibacter sp.]|nr:hypothetical protein [Usitatibacter sp.]